MSDEKVELRDIPLADENKTAEQNDTTETTEPPKETVAEKKTKFLQFFARDRPIESEKKTETEPAQNGESKEEDVDVKFSQPKKEVVKKSKPVQWFHKKTKPMKETEAEIDPNEHTDGGKKSAANMTIGLNMLDRDEKNLNDFVKLSFEDVFAEPDGYHGVDCNWRASYIVFTRGRQLIYKILSLLVGIPCAIFWGLIFAILTCIHIWGCVPAGRALSLIANWPAKIWKFLIRSIFDPCFRSMGLCFSGIHVHRHDPHSLDSRNPPV